MCPISADYHKRMFTPILIYYNYFVFYFCLSNLIREEVNNSDEYHVTVGWAGNGTIIAKCKFVPDLRIFIKWANERRSECLNICCVPEQQKVYNIRNRMMILP